jgi:hypothetical protein
MGILKGLLILQEKQLQLVKRLCYNTYRTDLDDSSVSPHIN